MATIVIRKLDDRVKAQLRLRAAARGRSMEEEARVILRAALVGECANRGREMVENARALFGPLGGIDLKSGLRETAREPPSFD